MTVNVVLIGGSSHVGKSTLAKSLASRFDWTHMSTDKLARHPGRPWRPLPEKVPVGVAEHYLSLPVDQLFEDVLDHYRTSVWPKVESIVTTHLHETSAPRIVLEGSALWPGFAVSLDFNRVGALWLTAREEIFRQRIYEESLYQARSRPERTLIDKFMDRTLFFNAKMIEAVNRHDLTLVDVSESDAAELAARCLASLKIDQPYA